MDGLCVAVQLQLPEGHEEIVFENLIRKYEKNIRDTQISCREILASFTLMTLIHRDKKHTDIYLVIRKHSIFDLSSILSVRGVAGGFPAIPVGCGSQRRDLPRPVVDCRSAEFVDNRSMDGDKPAQNLQ